MPNRCGQLAINLDPSSFAYNPSLQFDSPYSSLTPDLLQYFSPFPKLPGGIEIPPIPMPSGVGRPTDVMSLLLDKISPLLGALAVIWTVMNLIKCIIDVICAIPNPFKIIKAVRILLLDCLPPFLAFFPPFYVVYLILTIVRMIVALLIALLECIVVTIEGIKNLVKQLQEIKDAINTLGDGGAASFLALVQLACNLGASLSTCFGNLNVLGPIFDFLAPFLGLSVSASFPLFDFRFCRKSRDDEDPCPPASEMQRFLANPNDPAGFSFDPATTPVSCYPDLQSTIRLYDLRYGKEFEAIPQMPDLNDLLSDLNNIVNTTFTVASSSQDDVQKYIDGVNAFDRQTAAHGGLNAFELRINTFIDDLKCTLYVAACNTLDRFATTFESDKIMETADGSSFIKITITPREVGGNPIGPVGIGSIPTPYQPIIVTDLGEVFDIQETEEGSFVAKIRSSKVGVANVCVVMRCNTCPEENVDDGIPADLGDGYAETFNDGYNDFVVRQFVATMKFRDGRIISHSVSSIAEMIVDTITDIPLVGITEFPDPDGYGPSTFEAEEEQKCLRLEFTEPDPQIAVVAIGASGACG